MEMPPAATETPAIQAVPQWHAQVSGAGVALHLSDAGGAPLLRIACVRDPALMTIVAETFQAIGSEERLSLRVDGAPFLFVPDATIQQPSGVEAEAPIRGALLNRLEAAREVSAVYGTQGLGPYRPPDGDTVQLFVTAYRQIAGR